MGKVTVEVSDPINCLGLTGGRKRSASHRRSGLSKPLRSLKQATLAAACQRKRRRGSDSHPRLENAFDRLRMKALSHRVSVGLPVVISCTDRQLGRAAEAHPGPGRYDSSAISPTV